MMLVTEEGGLSRPTGDRKKCERCSSQARGSGEVGGGGSGQRDNVCIGRRDTEFDQQRQKSDNIAPFPQSFPMETRNPPVG
jgi:hypothetical protein